MKKLVVSPITNTIYLTNGKPMKSNPECFVSSGKKEDYTDAAISAVFQWFVANYENEAPSDGYELRYKGMPYVLTLTKEEKPEGHK